MSEEIDEKVEDNSLNSLTKEEVLETIRSIFKDNEESLKYIDNIISNLVGLKRLSVTNPTSTSLMTWIPTILLLFTGSWANNQSEELLKDEEDESDNKNGEGHPMEESTQCCQENYR